ncbi:MAG: hypothetical protein ACI9O6_000916 [Glaciecola sp.]|jgi:hypothetical protein
MKNLKPLIFAAHAELKPKLPLVKKSHLYEAFAAFSGFNSYAAFKVSSKIKFDDVEQANRLCFERMQSIGFDVGSALLICQRMEELSKQFNAISLDEIYKFYGDGLYEDTHVETQMLEALKAFVTSGSGDAVLLSLVFTTQIVNEYEEDPDNRSAEYWHKKLEANHELSGFQEEVAMGYEYIKPYCEFLEFLRAVISDSKSFVMPSPLSVKEVIQKFDDDVERHWTQYFSCEPDTVRDAFDYINSHNDSVEPIISESIYRDWYKAEAINFANRWLIAEIVDIASTDEEKWFWYCIGLHQGVDVTESDLRAIHADTGEDYDDHGPMDVVGTEGLSMPKVTKVLEDEMHAFASQISLGNVSPF